MGGCPRNAERGYVTATETVQAIYWRGGDHAGTFESGDELRLCRYEGPNAIVTVWSDGIGFVVPRTAVSSARANPSVHELTEQEVACVAPQIETIQREYRSDQVWALLELARQRVLSLSTLADIRMAAIRAETGDRRLPPCAIDSLAEATPNQTADPGSASLGCVENLSDWEAGSALSQEGETRSECYVFYSPSFDGSVNRVNVDGDDYSVFETSRREASAVDSESGVSRDYVVTIYEPNNGSFEIELWRRYMSDGFEGSYIFGGMILRKDGSTETIRVTGGAGP